MELINEVLSSLGINWADVLYGILITVAYVIVFLMKNKFGTTSSLMSTAFHENAKFFSDQCETVRSAADETKAILLAQVKEYKEELAAVEEEAQRKLEATLAENETLKEALKIMMEVSTND